MLHQTADFSLVQMFGEHDIVRNLKVKASIVRHILHFVICFTKDASLLLTVVPDRPSGGKKTIWEKSRRKLKHKSASFAERVWLLRLGRIETDRFSIKRSNFAIVDSHFRHQPPFCTLPAGSASLGLTFHEIHRCLLPRQTWSIFVQPRVHPRTRCRHTYAIRHVAP